MEERDRKRAATALEDGEGRTAVPGRVPLLSRMRWRRERELMGLSSAYKYTPTRPTNRGSPRSHWDCSPTDPIGATT